MLYQPAVTRAGGGLYQGTLSRQEGVKDVRTAAGGALQLPCLSRPRWRNVHADGATELN
jgi:hypothetical protein